MKKNTYQIRAIRTKADYLAALHEVAPYFDNEPEIDSDAGAHFEAMITLIEAYEAKHLNQSGTALLRLRGMGQGMFGASVGESIFQLWDKWL